MPAYPVLSTKVIGQAESALGAILDPILAETDTAFPQWLVLTVMAGNGGELELGQLISRITTARKVDREVVVAAVRELATTGLVTESPVRVLMTSDGRARHSQIRARVAGVTGRLFGDLAAADLETAGRILSIVTDRANAELARMTS